MTPISGWLPRAWPSEPLPEPTRLALEGLFRIGLANVRVRLSDRPLRHGAAAMASGDTIFVPPHLYRPGTPRGDALLAHEVAHLIQQQSGRVPEDRSRGAVIAIRPDLEMEADLWACLAVSGVHTRAPVSTLRELAPCEPEVFQPWILMAKKTGDDPLKYGTKDYSPPLSYGYVYFRPPTEGRGKPYDDRFELLDDVVTALKRLQAAYVFLFGKKLPRGVYDLLITWMGGIPRSGGKVLESGPTDFDLRKRMQVRGEFRYYHTWAELAWALEREHNVSVELAKEDRVADWVLESSTVLRLLRTLSKKVSLFLEKNVDKLKSVKVDLKPAYAPLHGQKTILGVVYILGNAGSVSSVSKLIALLHDAKDLFGVAKLINKSEPEIKLKVGHSKTILNISKYKSRYNVGTPDEADDWVLWMRDRNRPVWAGPSYTMLHMWRMAVAVKATKLEAEALAWAMFAYWNRDYPHTATPIHRFHGVMAASPLFELPYDPDADVTMNLVKFHERAKGGLFLKSKL